MRIKYGKVNYKSGYQLNHQMEQIKFYYTVFLYFFTVNSNCVYKFGFTTSSSIRKPVDLTIFEVSVFMGYILLIK